MHPCLKNKTFFSNFKWIGGGWIYSFCKLHEAQVDAKILYMWSLGYVRFYQEGIYLVGFWPSAGVKHEEYVIVGGRGGLKI